MQPMSLMIRIKGSYSKTSQSIDCVIRFDLKERKGTSLALKHHWTPQMKGPVTGTQSRVSYFFVTLRLCGPLFLFLA